MTAVEWSEVVRNWAIVAGGAVGFGIATWRAIVADRAAKAQTRQAELARREHVVEMFDKAVERLSSERLRDRLAALILLDDLVQRYPDLAAPAVKLIEAFWEEFRYAGVDAEPGPDHIKALQIMMRQNNRPEKGGD